MEFTIVSGGQTGVDRAALDVAIAMGVPHDGWCPAGRRAEDGILGAVYQLQETPSESYSQRTRWNVRDSDATVVFSESDTVRGGTALTIQIAKRMEKPLLHLSRDQFDEDEAAAKLGQFVATYKAQRLNVAGPRLSQQPAAAVFATTVLTCFLGDATTATA